MSTFSDLQHIVFGAYLRPTFEIAILSVLIYSALYYLRGTRGAPVLAGIVVVLMLFTFASEYLKFDVISFLLNNIWATIAMALIVIFQPEFRRAFAQIGSNPFLRGIGRSDTADEIAVAVQNLVARQEGALIVLEQVIGMRAMAVNMVPLDASLTHNLIESIFYKNSPLHDGGVLVKDGRIVAAHCIFPLAKDDSLTKLIGTRHSAAIGVTEETDALAVVVSEETGGVSLAYKGRLKKDIDSETLQQALVAAVGKVTAAKTTLDDIFE